MEQQKRHSTITKTLIILALFACLVLEIKLLVWAQRPEFCLINLNYIETDKNKVVMVFEEFEIPYKTNANPALLSVRLMDGRSIIERLGSDAIKLSDRASKLCNLFATDLQPQIASSQKAFWQTPIYLRAGKLIITGLTTMALILLIARPLLRSLIHPNGIEPEKDEKNLCTQPGEVISTPKWFAIVGTFFWYLIYFAALSLVFFAIFKERYDIPFVVIMAIIPAVAFYQAIHGIMSTQYYWAVIVIEEGGFRIKSRYTNQFINWSDIAKIEAIVMASVIHIYNKKGKRVYSASTDLESTHRLWETIKVKSGIED